MKILHLETGRHFYGGPAQVLYLMRGLAERDAENVLVCPPGSELARRARTSARVLEMPCHGDLDLGLSWRMLKCLRRERPALVHVHSRRGADWWGGLAAWRAGLPAVLSRRVDSAEGRLSALKYRSYRRVIAISRSVREQLLEAGVPARKIDLVSSAVEAADHQAERDRGWLLAELGIPRDVLLLGIVAQLIPRKGHLDLFKAMQRMEDRSAWLLVLGQGELQSVLRRQVLELGLGDRVVFAGFREDVPRVLPCLDVLVHPAHREGLGVSVLEAAAAGLPIVATNAGGLTDLVVHEKTGLLVEPGHPEDLARAIERIAGHRELALRLGAQARRLVLEEFSVDAMVEATLGVYERVLSNRRRLT